MEKSKVIPVSKNELVKIVSLVKSIAAKKKQGFVVVVEKLSAGKFHLTKFGHKFLVSDMDGVIDRLIKLFHPEISIIGDLASALMNAAASVSKKKKRSKK